MPLTLKNKAGFTLSELLISLAILGLIATFTLTKVLKSSNDVATRATGREAIATLSQVLFAGWRDGSLTNASNLAEAEAYLDSKLAVAYSCTTWDAPPCNHPYAVGRKAYVLPSGVYISIHDAPNEVAWASGGVAHLIVDINGVAGPNQDPAALGSYTPGDDLTALWFNAGSVTQNAPGRFTNLRPGELKADEYGGRDVLYRQLLGVPEAP